MKALFFIMLIFISSAEAEASKIIWPEPDFSNCDFYSKLEGQMKCKDRDVDYLSDYAPHYCQTFLKKTHEWDGKLKEWAITTGECLQTALYDQRNKVDSCEVLEQIAFATHSVCYSKADICRLKLKDISKILSTIKIKDLFRELRYSSGQIDKLVSECVKEWW